LVTGASVSDQHFGTIFAHIVPTGEGDLDRVGFAHNALKCAFDPKTEECLLPRATAHKSLGWIRGRVLVLCLVLVWFWFGLVFLVGVGLCDRSLLLPLLPNWPAGLRGIASDFFGVCSDFYGVREAETTANERPKTEKNDQRYFSQHTKKFPKRTDFFVRFFVQKFADH
jgi:hypothetical protein